MEQNENDKFVVVKDGARVSDNVSKEKAAAVVENLKKKINESDNSKVEVKQVICG